MSHLGRFVLGLTSPPRRPTVQGADMSAFSTSPSQLQEVTMEADMTASSCRSPLRGSPGQGQSQGRTMKDYEEQLAALRKENFNLKLRIYFLEERLDAAHAPASNQENLLKMNIDLKVNLEGLRRDVNEKKELLCAAARALELVEADAAKREASLMAQLNALQDQLNSCGEAIVGKPEKNNVNSEDVSGINADDSVALYAAAFNLKPTTKDLHKQAVMKAASSCECSQLRTSLVKEQETAALLREEIAERDDLLNQKLILIDELNEKLSTAYTQDALPSSTTQDCVEETERYREEEKLQLDKLKQENINACQMIQGCLVRIKKMDRENKKMKASLQRKEERIISLQNQVKLNGVYIQQESSPSEGDNAASGDSNLHLTSSQHYLSNDILNIENSTNQLFLLDNEVRDNSKKEKQWRWMDPQYEQKVMSLCNSICGADKMDKSTEKMSSGETEQKNVQELLTRRLQEMAYFLDSLLSHRCVLGEEKRKKVESLLEQSLELPVGLKLDPEASRQMEDSFDVTFGQMSQSFNLKDITRLLGHHDETCTSQQSLSVKKSHNEDGKSLHKIVHQQEQAIEQLSSELKYVRSRCICGSTADEDSDDKMISNVKVSFNDSNKVSPRKSKIRGLRPLKLNTTWHGGMNLGVEQEESDCWSEPDRSVSLARMGGPIETAANVLSSEEECHRCSHNKRTCNASNTQQDSVDGEMFKELESMILNLTEEKTNYEKLLADAKATINDLQRELERNKLHYTVDMKSKEDEINKLTQKLDEAELSMSQFSVKHQNVIERLEKEKSEVEKQLDSARNSVKLTKDSLAAEKRQHGEREQLYLNQLKEITDGSNRRLKELQDKIDVEYIHRNRYEALRREADNAALQASQATLDRVQAEKQRMRSDAEAERLNRCLSTARLRHSELESQCAELQNRLVHLESWQASASRALASPRPASRSPPRATSPDQGIDSDRLSSLEMVESGLSRESYSPPDLAAENVLLRSQLERTQRHLEEARARLSATKSSKQTVHRAICHELHKTNSVLRQVRDNLNSDS